MWSCPAFAIKLVAIVFSSLPNSPAVAWGADGHKAIDSLAYHYVND